MNMSLMNERPDPELNALRNAVSDALSREISLRTQLTTAHYDMIDIRAELEAARVENVKLRDRVTELGEWERDSKVMASA